MSADLAAQLEQLQNQIALLGKVQFPELKAAGFVATPIEFQIAEADGTALGRVALANSIFPKHNERFEAFSFRYGEHSTIVDKGSMVSACEWLRQRNICECGNRYRYCPCPGGGLESPWR